MRITGFNNLDRLGAIEITFEEGGVEKSLILDQNKVKDMEDQIKMLRGSYNYLREEENNDSEYEEQQKAEAEYQERMAAEDQAEQEAGYAAEAEAMAYQGEY